MGCAIVSCFDKTIWYGAEVAVETADMDDVLVAHMDLCERHAEALGVEDDE